MKFDLIRAHFAIFIVLAITLPSLIFGLNSWPFFSYPMYSYPPGIANTFVLMAEKSDGSVFQIRNQKILFPIRPNGFNEKVYKILSNENSKKRLSTLLQYLFNRSVRLDPKIQRIFILQNNSTKEKASSSEKFPKILSEYGTK